jgi:hypothetical protein
MDSGAPKALEVPHPCTWATANSLGRHSVVCDPRVEPTTTGWSANSGDNRNRFWVIRLPYPKPGQQRDQGFDLTRVDGRLLQKSREEIATGENVRGPRTRESGERREEQPVGCRGSSRNRAWEAGRQRARRHRDTCLGAAVRPQRFRPGKGASHTIHRGGFPLEAKVTILKERGEIDSLGLRPLR